MRVIDIPELIDMPEHFLDFCYTMEIVATRDDMFYVNGCTMATEEDNFDMFVVSWMQKIISQEENDRSICVEEIMDENVVNDHVEEEENTPPPKTNHTMNSSTRWPTDSSWTTTP